MIGDDGRLLFLAFDHRESFAREVLGRRRPEAADEAQVREAKRVAGRALAQGRSSDRWDDGFAIGRAIWKAPRLADLAGEIDRESVALEVRDRFLHFAGDG